MKEDGLRDRGGCSATDHHLGVVTRLTTISGPWDH